MRFPTDNGTIDEREAIRMLHAAIDGGVNYLDTAWPYHDGQSEPLVGRALAQGSYRGRVRVATKLPSWLIKSPADLDSYLDRQLDRLQLGTVDFYLLHALSRTYWDTLLEFDVLRWAERARAAGKIRYLGFSFHDSFDVFEEIVTAYAWDFCQIQYNYMNVNYQAGRKGLRLAARRGIPVVVMEPLLGGNLASAPPTVRTVWDRAAVRRSPAEWALQWLWDQPEVTTVLSGMSTMEQIEENLAAADRSKVGVLSEEERTLVRGAKSAFDELAAIPCTECRYCMPCPYGVNIPRNFAAYNKAEMYGNLSGARGEYAWMEKAFAMGLDKTDERAASCIQCRRCEPKCPQHIVIADEMQRVHSTLSASA